MAYAFTPLTPAEKKLAHEMAQVLQISPIVAEILYQRGLRDIQKLKEYLFPQLSSLPDPFTMKGMQEAVNRVILAKKKGQVIYIHGDYDVDGISSTALLQSFFTQVGIISHFYIPDRTKEHYGLSRESIDKLLDKDKPAQSAKGALLITVDCGISSHAEVDYIIKQYDCDVIITDHHLPGQSLPPALAILNPKQKGCAFPFSYLAGVGVAFFFVLALRRAMVEMALLSKENMPNLKELLDLVALGTIADVVPLVDINRILVRGGLEVLATRKRIGIKALADKGNVFGSVVTSEDIAFRLAPRLNACGRLGQPHIGVKLLLAQDLASARSEAAHLESLNNQRKRLENEVTKAIIASCEKQVEEGREALSVYNEACHPGVLGILASRMVEQFERPGILFTDDLTEKNCEQNRQLKGSGRSVAGINLFQILQACREKIEQFGGHPMAAGLQILKDNFEDFSRSFHLAVLKEKQNYETQVKQNMARPVDYTLSTENLGQQNFIQTIQLMEPCGEGNPEPLFFLEPKALEQIRMVGNNEHVSFQLRLQNKAMAGIGFNLAQQFAVFPGDESALIFKLKKRYYQGQERPQIQVVEFLGPKMLNLT